MPRSAPDGDAKDRLSLLGSLCPTAVVVVVVVKE